MKADWKARLLRREAEDWGLLALLFLLVVGLALVTIGGRCLACGLGVEETSALLGTLAQSLSAIFAIAFSVTLVAVQLAATAYTPRILRLHMWSFYFVGLFATYLVTIGYLFFLQAAGRAYLGSLERLGVDVGLVLSLFSLAYLAPFTAHTVRFLMPARVLKVLLSRLKREDFRHALAPVEKLQPVEDLIIRAMAVHDHYTARERLHLLAERHHELTGACEPRSDQGRNEALAITIPFVELLERVGMWCNHNKDFEMLDEVFGRFQTVGGALAEQGVGEANPYLEGMLDRLLNSAREWFEKGKSGVEMGGVERAVADVRAALAQMLK